MVRFLLGAIVVVGLFACGKKELSDPTPSASSKATAVAEGTYKTRGVIKSFGEGRKSAKIAHEDIPGFMKAMTMPFAASSPTLFDGLKEGDAVEFSFVEGAGGMAVIQTLTKK